jgi:hypothetical protein
MYIDGNIENYIFHNYIKIAKMNNSINIFIIILLLTKYKLYLY